MNKEVTNRFLRSINIENVDDFDMCFSKSYKENDGTYVFEISKDTEWDYDLLSYFIEKLANINYKYKLKFTYKNEITNEGVFNIFRGLYEKINHYEFDHDYEFNNNILIIYGMNLDKDSSRLIEEFNQLIRFINYPLYSVIFRSDFVKSIEITNDFEINNKENIDLLESNDDLIEPSFYDNEEVLEDSDFLDFEDEFNQLVETESKAFSEELHYMDDKLQELDSSKRYKEYCLNDIKGPGLYFYSEGYIFTFEKEEKGGKYIFNAGFYIPGEEQYATFRIEANDGFLNIDHLNSFKKDDKVAFTGYSYISKNKFGNKRNSGPVYVITSIKKIGEKPVREDNLEEKRVELHLHTKMSAMDGVTSIEDYCKLASSMGHKAIALTDHGVVQAYPYAQKAAKQYGIKMLYGCEFYVTDDNFVGAINVNDKLLSDATFVAFDLETTGLSCRFNKIIEFGAIKFKNNMEIGRKDILINPKEKLSDTITRLTHISDEMLKDKPSIDECLDEILDFIDGCVLISHNLEFDYNFLNEACKRIKGHELNIAGIDTLTISQFLFPEASGHRLGNVCNRFDVEYDGDSAHRADYDANVLYKVFIPISDMLIKKGYKTVSSIKYLPKSPENIKHSRLSHLCAIAKNREGLKAIYKLVSLSHVKYYGKFPTVPKSKLIELRENLLLGSACFNGEVFDVASRLNKEKLDEVVSFYDYIEIQPLTNYMFLVNSYTNGFDDVSTIEKVLDAIIESAKSQNKLICATGDVHFLNPEDKIFREVYVYNAGVGKTAHPLLTFNRKKLEEKGIYFEDPDQYYRSTKEMLDEFSRYGKENAYEWVVTNTNKIADSCEVIIPIPEDHLFTPKIDNCENMLEELCYENAHKLYGDPLPPEIEKRLKRELRGIQEGDEDQTIGKGGIIHHGYSVIYYIAYKIIQKAHEDGYIVGSRGSVGSSFVATMANITEVNPLKPHYRCPKCKHFEFYEGNEFFSGYDLPVKKCPCCGEEMISDGQNIPFETFLGFDADKVPDIDLNFPPDYQAKAHNYTKVLLGEQNVFRAGTIGTVATKTAFGYARGYFEKRFKIEDLSSINPAKISYLAAGCADVKRTTGQHPGGIVVIPSEYEVYDFTPVQYPADDMDAEWMTTHFEFSAIHDTVLKLDLLGHVDPQALKFMCSRLNIDYRKIPLTDKKVLSLFSSPDALNLSHNYLKLTNGALALPEFGTSNVRGMLDSIKPTTFNDLIIVSGLSHGTDVWKGNAESLILSNIATLREVIGCRDDIMTYLIRMGVPNKQAFTIMESVRKGKGLKEEQIALLKEHNVPDYYIESCLKIKYLFPKAHATAYVTMAVRVGYFKVYYPLYFYAGFFSVRCDKYDWEAMYKGVDAILKRLDELKQQKQLEGSKFSKTSEEVVKTLTVALEFYDRGFKFSNLDIMKSDSRDFIVDEENKSLIPPFKVIDGLGDSVAQSIVEARENGNFISIEDFTNRCKINDTQLNTFKTLGVFKGLPEKEVEQGSLFDFL